MKKIIVFLAIVAIFAIAFNSFSELMAPLDPNYNVTDSKETDLSGSESSTGNVSDVTTQPVPKYNYVVNIYEQGTSTKLFTLKLESEFSSASLRISGNVIYLEASDTSTSVQFTDYVSVDSLSKSTVSYGTTSVYITYTEKSSSSHTHSYTVTKAATCTASGTETCSCGETQTIAALGHEWGEDVVFIEPTCTEAGTGGCVCRLCGIEDRSLYLYPTGHSYTNGICENCGDTYIPHTHSYTVTKAATCTASGTETCSCGATQTIAATGHSYSVTKAATCTSSGIKTCGSCGATQTIAATGHKYGSDSSFCSVCGYDKEGCITCGDPSVVTSCSACGKSLGYYCMDHQPYGSYCSVECAG